jgi:hypothetical protein
MKAIDQFVLIMVLFLAVSLVLFAQVTAKTGKSYQIQSQPGDMMPETIMPLHFSDRAPGSINPETEYPGAVKRFRKLFPGAVKEVWYKEGKNLFVYFFHKGNKVTAVFTLRGHMNYAIANLDITDLPAAIINKIESLYEGYGLFNVKQIMEDNSSIYEIVLVSSCEYIVINVSEEGITEKKKIRKL